MKQILAQLNWGLRHRAWSKSLDLPMATHRTDLESAFAAQQAGNLQAAKRFFESALAREPNDVRTLLLYGALLTTLKETRKAISLIERCLALQPGLAMAHNALGNALQGAGEPKKALAAYRRAVSCQPPSMDAFCNLGGMLRAEGAIDEAIAIYQQALAHKSNFVEVLCNLGVAYKALNRLDEAMDAYARALVISPDFAEAHFNQGITYLLVGDFARGWPKHEYRWQTVQRHVRRDFRKPLWLGNEPIEGRTVLAHAEQGLGDTLQFVRYVPELVSRGASVVLEVQPSLSSLLSSMGGVSRLVAKGETLPYFDLHCPLLSLPLACSLAGEYPIPGNTPYLRAPADRVEKWKPSVSAMEGPKVGFVWFGNREHCNDRNRSLPPDLAAALVRETPFRLVSLQKGIKDPADAALAAMPQVIDLAAGVSDFSDTAAIIGGLDLVITVDTSVAHLAGTLGKPVWILLPFAPDWRWLLMRGDSPWYPTARLFRQEKPGDWCSVIKAVQVELRNRFSLGS